MEWCFCLIASFWVLFKVDCLLKGSPQHSRGFPFLPISSKKHILPQKNAICHKTRQKTVAKQTLINKGLQQCPKKIATKQKSLCGKKKSLKMHPRNILPQNITYFQQIRVRKIKSKYNKIIIKYTLKK